MLPQHFNPGRGNVFITPWKSKRLPCGRESKVVFFFFFFSLKLQSIELELPGRKVNRGRFQVDQKDFSNNQNCSVKEWAFSGCFLSLDDHLSRMSGYGIEHETGLEERVPLSWEAKSLRQIHSMLISWEPTPGRALYKLLRRITLLPLPPNPKSGSHHQEFYHRVGKTSWTHTAFNR